MTAAHVLASSASPIASGSAITDELESLAERLRRVTVRIHTRGERYDGFGAGVLWTHRGRSLVVTNAHVVPSRRGDRPSVEDHAGHIVEAPVVARDRERDLAVLAVDTVPDEWPAPAISGEDRLLRTGEIVVALGHPFGVAGSLSVGIVHAAPDGGDRWLLADVRLAPGNSGGPLATLDGMVVGINSMIVRGLGVAIPAAAVRAFVERALGGPNEAG